MAGDGLTSAVNAMQTLWLLLGYILVINQRMQEAICITLRSLSTETGARLCKKRQQQVCNSSKVVAMMHPRCYAISSSSSAMHNVAETLQSNCESSPLN